MLLTTSLSHCVLRPWRDGDQDDLVQHANNRKVWRNLTHLFICETFVCLQTAVFAWNTASMRVRNKAGAEREGVMRSAVSKDGEIVDGVICACVA